MICSLTPDTAAVTEETASAGVEVEAVQLPTQLSGELVQPLEIVWTLLKKWKITLLCDSTAPPEGFYLKEIQAEWWRGNQLSHINPSSIHSNQSMKSACVLQWRIKENVYI